MTHEPDRADYLIALAVGLCALAMYVRTLAPDILYGDAAEFQTLAYTLGMTHCTGYPTYLLMGRLLGFLPIGSPAWRINLLSAVGAAVTVAGVFLLIRHLTRSRAGALLGCAALALSYTFWSQAIIAEVYTPATALLSLIMLLLWRWHSAPLKNNRALLAGGLLAGVGLGVHASVALIAPAAAAFIVWTRWSRRMTGAQWRRSAVAALLGLGVGVAIFLLAFLSIDLNDPPSSFYQAALYPSRSAWGLELSDLDTPWERFVVTVTGRQWQDAMFPGGDHSLWGALKEYAGRVAAHEFPPLTLLCALLGVAVMLRTAPSLGGFVVLSFVTMLLVILNYEPPDKFIFFLPTYIPLAVATGTGAGYLLEAANQGRPTGPKRSGLATYVLCVALLTLLVAAPFLRPGWQALRAGAGTFVREHYPYPLYHLEEPRRLATQRLAQVPDGAVLILEWRGLYATCYLAHVELGRTDLLMMEATPHGSGGVVTATLIKALTEALHEGRPVYADRIYKNLERHFRVRPVPGSDLYRLTLRE
jgi:hypothetical protein